MSNFYAEGVGLKVAEKYKVPPRIAVPRDVIGHLCGDHYKRLTSDPELEYNFDLERNVIQKIEQWQRVHDQAEQERQEQLQARDRERRLLIEQQQKQLLNQVSYPSTEDLSSDGEEAEKSKDNASGEDDSSGTNTKEEPAAKVAVTSAHRLQGDFSTILQPTIVPESKTSGGGPTWSSVLLAGGVDKSKTSCSNNNLNYSDWESDNYSPFDRMELKSINDLDILAQVLQTTQLNNKSSSSPAAVDNKETSAEPPQPPPSPPSSPIAAVELEKVSQEPPRDVVTVSQPEPSQPQNVHSYVTPWNMPNPTQSPVTVQHSLHNGQSEAICTFQNYQLPTTHQSYVKPQPMQHCQPSVSAGYYDLHLQNQYHHSNIPAYPPTSSFPTHYSANYSQYPNQVGSPPPVMNDHFKGSEPNPSSSSLLRSRSKSVPDIVNELEEEVKASEERRRVRNHSQSSKGYAAVPDDDDHEESSPSESVFERLPRESKDLVLKIATMGFSVNVVAAVVEQLGNDDKKIIEHLIPLSELLDLGFGISPTSEALLKFNNNRERALDFLIS